MKNIIFINPSMDKYADIKYWTPELMSDLTGRVMTFMPKLSAMIFGALTPKEYNYRFLDEEIEDIDFENIQADLVAITTMSVQANRAYQIADRFRTMGKTVVIGGIHATVMREEAARHCDAVMIGEGERTWVEMLKDADKGTLKAVYDAKDYPLVTEFVSPRCDVIKHEHYLMYPIQATRGCPNNCDFCSIRFSSGRKYRMKPVEQVVAEIKELERYNKGIFLGQLKKSYQFVDDNLYVDREYTKALFTAMKDLKITWSGQGTLDTAGDDEILKLMAESGCRSFSIGFESISDESLKEANKPKYNKVSDYQGAIQKLIKYGIPPSGYFVYGFNSDGADVFRKTLEFTKNNHLVQTHFSVLTPYPGTTLWDRINSEGGIVIRDWQSYNSLQCVFSPRQMSPEELESGAYWSALMASDLENLKVQLRHFWDHGPWKSNPLMNMREKLLLRLIGWRLRKNEKYRDFLYWAAGEKNAVSMGTVVTSLAIHDLTQKVEFCYDPAEKRLEEAV